MELTEANVKNGLTIMCLAHPEWGTWTIREGEHGWEIDNGRGCKALDLGELGFWVASRKGYETTPDPWPPVGSDEFYESWK